MLEDIKRLLGIDDTALDNKLRTILRSVQARLRILLGGVEDVPEELTYIVTEVSIIRFNRIGSEGMSSHSVEGESISFSDDDFAGYMSDIKAYLDEQKEAKRGRVRFI